MSKVYHTYTLEYPFEFGSEMITAIDLARPCAGDMKSFKLENYSMNDQIELVRKLAKIPNSSLPVTPKLVDAIDFSDFLKMGEIIASWFPKPAST